MGKFVVRIHMDTVCELKAGKSAPTRRGHGPGRGLPERTSRRRVMAK
jgi:hypothetical protein